MVSNIVGTEHQSSQQRKIMRTVLLAVIVAAGTGWYHQHKTPTPPYGGNDRVRMAKHFVTSGYAFCRFPTTCRAASFLHSPTRFAAGWTWRMRQTGEDA